MGVMNGEVNSVLVTQYSEKESRETSISSKQRNSFVRNFHRLLRRKLLSFVQYYESLHKWCDFGFEIECVIFKRTRLCDFSTGKQECCPSKLKLLNNQIPCVL